MITVQWANTEKTLLKWQFHHRWTRTDFLNACHTSKAMITNIDHTIHILVDLTDSRSHPSNIIYLVLTGMRMKTETTGQIVLISPSQLWLRLYQYMKRVYAKDMLPVEFVSSHYEATMVLKTLYLHDTIDTKHPLPAYTGQFVAPFYTQSYV